MLLLKKTSEPGIDGKLVPGDRIDIAQVRKVGHGEAGNCSPQKNGTANSGNQHFHFHDFPAAKNNPFIFWGRMALVDLQISHPFLQKLPLGQDF